MDPVYYPRERLEAARGGRPFEAASGLWWAGDLSALAHPTVAIVGTRAATPLGRRLAREIAAQLGRSGCCVISGLALGIDAHAHQGALDAGAPTVGVLGGGHHWFFPRRNRALAEAMLAAGGAVVSPFPPERPPQPGQFLARNGVVAALSDAVLVVEAPARSGALNTAGWAAGRIPVMAMPGDVDRKHVQGCLALIRDGATLARNADDVLEALGLCRSPQLPLPGSKDNALLAALDGGARTVDELAAATGLDPPAVLAALTVLELDGDVAIDGGACRRLR